MGLFELLSCLTVFVVCCFHIFLAPFNKVEESFNTQAMHDLLFHGMNVSNVRKSEIWAHFSYFYQFDHLEFPGVVPRTFLGAILVSSMAFPFSHFFSRFAMLLLCRVCMAAIFCVCVYDLQNALNRYFGSRTGSWFAILLASQFHLCFYATRPLPNTFSLLLSMVAIAQRLRGHGYNCLAILTFATIWFRCDLLVFMLPLMIFMLVNQEVKFLPMCATGVAAGGFAVAVTVLVDSYFWQRWIWPELEVLYFNTILNKSSDWGVSAWHWYFTSALPRSLLLSMLAIPFGLFLWNRSKSQFKLSWDRNSLIFIGPALAYVLLYSNLAHKELRFIFPAAMLLTAVAGHGLNRLWTNRGPEKSLFSVLITCFCIGVIAGNTLLTSVFSYAAMNNYPAGHAMLALSEHVRQTNITGPVHIDQYSAETGASRFLETPELGLQYSKDENLQAHAGFQQFCFLITANPQQHEPQFKCIHEENAFQGFNLRDFHARIEPAVYIMQNDAAPAATPCHHLSTSSIPSSA